jgi:predicted transcriptional regulator
MADGALTIELDGLLADEVRAAAKARGLSPEEYVRQQLAFDIALGDEFDDDDIAEDVAALAEYDRTGMGVPADEVAAWLASLGTDNELPRPRPRKLK